MYGSTSPSGPPYQYMGMGYVPGAPSPRTSFSPMQQPARPPFIQQTTAQMEGSFPPGPSLPPNFRLQLPPHAVSSESDNASGMPLPFFVLSVSFGAETQRTKSF